MNEFQRYFVWEFVEDYKSGQLSRRELIRRVVNITGGAASAATLLTLMGCGAVAPPSAAVASSAPSKPAASASAKPAASAAASAEPAAAGSTAAAPQPTPSGPKSPLSVPENDPAVDARMITFQGNGATLMAYETRPVSATGPLPLVMVCHENMGLQAHIKDVTRRFAKAGYMAAALDLLSREGGTDKVPPERISAALSAAGQGAPADFKALAEYYLSQPAKAVAIGMNGYCFGGSITWRTVEIAPMIKAAVPFYGSLPPLDLVKDIKAAVFGVYSSDPNDNANARRDELEAALKSANLTYQLKAYPGTTHAFHNDTRPTAPPGNFYNQEQALAAWKDMLDWFGKYLKA